MPMPMPSSTRQAISASTLCAVEHSQEAAPHSTMLHWNTGRRPKRSASSPATAAPSTMPKKLALATRPAAAVLRPNSLRIEPSTKVMVPRSTESKKNAIATITKISL